MHDEHRNTRREFLQKSTAGAVTATLASGLIVPRSVHAGGTETLKVGLIGCGGRGQGAAEDALLADPHAELTAVADTFADRAQQRLENLRRHEAIGDRVRVDDDHVFVGFDAFRDVVHSGVDVVLLATPPHFRPEHLEYVVAAGKHCFCEKPVAVDVPGVKRAQAACDEAKQKGLSLVSGLCLRYDLGTRATVDQVHNGAVGDIVAIHSLYNAGTLWHRGDDPAWSRMEYQLRNWLYYTWLSGDHLVEQAVHSVDRATWLLGDTHPVQAVGMGGRQQRTDPKWGNIYDHHNVVYEFPNDVKVFFSCRQQDNVATEVEEHIMGTKGRGQLLKHAIQGETRWRYRGPEVNMYRKEHEELFASIRSGGARNDGDYMCNSTLIAIMGRLATYTGQVIKWDDLLANQQRLGPEEYAWIDVPEPPVAIPGQTQA